MDERRQAQRVPKKVKVDVRDFIHNRTRRFSTVDVSRSGLFLQTRFPRTVGETVLLYYPQPGTRHATRIEAEVVRTVDSEAARGKPGMTRGMGIQFVRVIDHHGPLL